MKTIILSPGPSLNDFTPRPSDLLIGVNRAALRFEVDVWACGDLPAVELYAPTVCGDPLLLSYGVTLDTMRDRGIAWRGETFSWSVLADQFLHPTIVNWPWTTFLSSVAYAGWRGATSIEIFGCDWSGKLDYDGAPAGNNRSDDRWQHERGIFKALRDYLSDRGVSITRWINGQPQ